MKAEQLLREVYHGYAAFHLPSRREAYFRKQFARHDPLRAEGPHTDDTVRLDVPYPDGIVWMEGPYTREDVHAYVANLCHAIFVEEYLELPWSLTDYSPREIGFLLERTVRMSGWTSNGKGTTGCWGESYPGQPVPREPIADEWYKAFPLSFYLIGRDSDQHEAALRLIFWIMHNFFHAYKGEVDENWSWDKYRFAVISLAEYFNERIVGCHGAANILTALLRSVNIPALEIHYNEHGICYIPSLERYVHGDFMADFAILKDNSILLMDLPELEKWVLHERDYLSFNDHIHSTYRPYHDVRLRRRDRSLFVAQPSSKEDDLTEVPPLSSTGNPGFYAALQVRLAEYGIHEVNGKYYSQLLPIRGLDELPECGLTLAIDKDANGYVVVTLENRGCRLPIGQGELLIEVDGAQRLRYSLSPWVDDTHGFIMGGVRSPLRTNIQIGADEHGMVQATLKNLPAPCQTVDTMRHLGKPLEPIDGDIRDITLDIHAP